MALSPLSAAAAAASVAPSSTSPSRGRHRGGVNTGDNHGASTGRVVEDSLWLGETRSAATWSSTGSSARSPACSRCASRIRGGACDRAPPRLSASCCPLNDAPGDPNTKLRTTHDGLIAQDPDRDRWIRLPDERDLTGYLAGGQSARDRAAAALAAEEAIVV